MLDDSSSHSFDTFFFFVPLKSSMALPKLITMLAHFCSGALTHSVKALDISLKIDTELALEVGRRTKRA